MKRHTVYIGADHGGFTMKETLRLYVEQLGFVVHDIGAYKLDAKDDYPVYAYDVAHAVAAAKGSKGILICRSGQGVCIAANRISGVRAALCWNSLTAKASRNDDDANILCLGADFVSNKQAKEIVKTWLETSFAKEARFKRRIRKIEEGIKGK